MPPSYRLWNELTEVKTLSYGHPAGERWNQNLNPGGPPLPPECHTTIPQC
jgi:hypothetical protein